VKIDSSRARPLVTRWLQRLTQQHHWFESQRYWSSAVCIEERGSWHRALKKRRRKN
jgi:hypothetical protein